MGSKSKYGIILSIFQAKNLTWVLWASMGLFGIVISTKIGCPNNMILIQLNSINQAGPKGKGLELCLASDTKGAYSFQTRQLLDKRTVVKEFMCIFVGPIWKCASKLSELFIKKIVEWYFSEPKNLIVFIFLFHSTCNSIS